MVGLGWDSTQGFPEALELLLQSDWLAALLCGGVGYKPQALLWLAWLPF